jgi:hypothetical protein
MKRTLRGDRLIRELLNDPTHFNGNELLKEYFDGFPLGTLRPLLSSSDRMVRRVAVWVASELGKDGKQLISDAVSLLHDGDPYIRFYALDTIAVCSLAEEADKYMHVVRALEDSDEGVRSEAMFLMSNANLPELKAALGAFGAEGEPNELHMRGVSQLLTEHVDAAEISGMIDSPEPLLRKYGAIAAWRCRDRFPDLISNLAPSTDPDIRKFWRQRAGP